MRRAAALRQPERAEDRAKVLFGAWPIFQCMHGLVWPTVRGLTVKMTYGTPTYSFSTTFRYRNQFREWAEAEDNAETCSCILRWGRALETE